MGLVITFYSYKGGTGRSMALANVATILSQWGKKTLIIDWDLEAPGLESFFEKDTEEADFRGTKGIADVLYEMSEHPQDSALVSGWKDAVIHLKFKEGSAGQQRIDRSAVLDFVGAGNRASVTGYFRKVRKFDVEDFYDKQGFHRIEELRSQWVNPKANPDAYDYVLIDSRTGVTDISGICTIQLPDILVTIFTPTRQSLNGTIAVADTAIRKFQNLPIPRLTFCVLPVASRFDFDQEFETSQSWLKESSNRLKEFYKGWAGEKVPATQLSGLTCIPHKSSNSFDETLPVLRESGNNAASIAYSYTNIAALLVHNLEKSDQLVSDRDAYVAQCRPESADSKQMGAIPDEEWAQLDTLIIMSVPEVGRNADGRLQVFARSHDGTLLYRVELEPGSDMWSNWTSGGGDVYEPCVVSNADGRLEVFAKGNRGDLWHTWQTKANKDMWSEWHSLGGVLHSPPALGRDHAGRLVVFMQGTDGALWYRRQWGPGSPDSPLWTNWRSLGGTIIEPTVISNGDGRLEVFALGQDGALSHIWQIDKDTEEWSSWSSLGGRLRSAPAVARNEDDRLEVFASWTGGVLMHIFQRRAGEPAWGDWQSLSKGAREPQVLNTPDGRLHVFARGNNNDLWHRCQDSPNNGWGSWKCLGGILQEASAVTLNANNRIQVFVRGTNGRLWRRFA